MQLATQPSSLPTHKLAVGATLAALVSTYAGPVVAEVWPQVMPAAFAGPAVTGLVQALVGMLAALAVAYWVPDAANVPV